MKNEFEVVKPEGGFHPGINSIALHQSGNDFPQDVPLRREDAWIGNKLWRLYVPVHGDVPDSGVMSLIMALREMGLAGSVPVSFESCDENLQFLRRCVDSDISAAEPYLEVFAGGCSASVAYFRGDEILRELATLTKDSIS